MPTALFTSLSRRLQKAAAALEAWERRDARLLVWVCWGAMLAAGLVHGLVHGLAYPYADELVLCDFATGHQQPTFPWYFSLHNEHRAPVFRIVYIALGEATHYDFRRMSLANPAVLALGAAAYLVTARKLRGRNSPVDLIVPSLLQHLGHQLSLTMPHQWMCTAYTALSLLCLLVVLKAERPLRVGPAALLTVMVVLMVGCGAYSAVYAAALTLWLGLSGLGQLRDPATRVRGGVIVFLAGLAVAALAAFVLTLPNLAANPLRSPNLVSTGIGALHFMVTAMGPTGRAFRPIVDVFMFAAVIAGVAWTWLAVRHGRNAPNAFGLLLFLLAGIGTALLTAYGRAGGGLGDLYQSRYAVISAPLLCGVIIGWDFFAAAAWRRRFVIAVLPLVPLVFLINARKGLEDSRERTERMDAIADQLRAGASTTDVAASAATYLQCPAPRLAVYFDRMKACRIGPYRDWSEPGSIAANRDEETLRTASPGTAEERR